MTMHTHRPAAFQHPPDVMVQQQPIEGSLESFPLGSQAFCPSTTLPIPQLHEVVQRIHGRFGDSLAVIQAWLVTSVSSAGEFSMATAPHLGASQDLQTFRKGSCSSCITLKNSMPAKVRMSGNVQIVQSLRIIPPSLHPRTRLTDLDLTKLGSAVYLPVFSASHKRTASSAPLPQPSGGAFAVIEVLLCARAPESMLAADVISYASQALAAVRLSVSNPVPQAPPRNSLTGRKAPPPIPEEDEPSCLDSIRPSPYQSRLEDGMKPEARPLHPSLPIHQLQPAPAMQYCYPEAQAQESQHGPVSTPLSSTPPICVGLRASQAINGGSSRAAGGAWSPSSLDGAALVAPLLEREHRCISSDDNTYMRPAQCSPEAGLGLGLGTHHDDGEKFLSSSHHMDHDHCQHHSDGSDKVLPTIQAAVGLGAAAMDHEYGASSSSSFRHIGEGGGKMMRTKSCAVFL